MDRGAPWMRDRLLWAILIGGAVAAVAIGAAFVTASRTPLNPTPGPTPTVDLGNPTYGSPGDASVAVSRVSRDVGLGQFRVTLNDISGATTVFVQTLQVGTLFSNGSAAVTFEDGPPAGTLNVGDTFRLLNMPTSHTYSLLLEYTPSSRTVASVTINL